MEHIVTSELPVSLDAISFRVRAEGYGNLIAGIPGYLYQIFAVDKDGNEQFLPGVKSFKFEVDADGCGLVTLTYRDGPRNPLNR